MTQRPNLPDRVDITEVGARDGLQNLGGFVPTETKIQFIRLIKETGIRHIDITAFVSPKWVPQMRDAAEIVAAFPSDGAFHKVLVPNRRGLELAIANGVREVIAVMGASEAHNKSNVNRTVAESLTELVAMADVARQAGVVMRANIATAFGCDIEGRVPCGRVLGISRELEAAGYVGITLCDTTGVGDPALVQELCAEVVANLKHAQVGAHFHQCDGMEFANVYAALLAGVRMFDSAYGGLGGCPFAPGADGNIATELLVRFFSRLGIATGVDAARIAECGKFAARIQSDFYAKVA